MVKIKEGIYVRVDGEIGKIESISPDRKQIQLDTGEIFDTNDIKKCSKNLIDLVEEGDIVEKQLVQYIDEKEMGTLGKIKLYKKEDIENENNIEILTHEQYENNCYKVRS